MRRIAIVAAVLAGLAGGCVAPPAAQAGCAYIIVWHDRAYSGFGGPKQRPVEAGRPVNGAVFPACSDTVGADAHATSAPARRVVGIPSSVVLLSGDETVVAFGYFPQLPGFPVDNGAAPVDETGNCRLGGPVRITGDADLGLGTIIVHVRQTTVRLHHLFHGTAQVSVDRHTRFSGLRRNGLPYVGQGQAVRLDARFCKVPGSIGNKIVARRVSPAGPIVAPSTAEDVLGGHWRAPGREIAHDVTRDARGYGWEAGVALVLAAGVGALLLSRRRPRSSGTG
jgi:hypothetical protein